jgi:hypothetical protein
MIVVYGLLVVGGACLAAIVGLALVQRLVPTTIRKEHNEVAGFIYAVVGVIYAVLLALVVIATWEEFGRARVTVETEANALAEIFWLAHRLPEAEGRELQELCRSYAEEVVNVGFPLMEQGRTPSLERSEESSRAWVLIDDIRASLQEVEPTTLAGQELYAEGLDQVQRLGDARRMRLVVAEESLPTVFVGRSDCWGDCGGGLRLPLRHGEQLGARADGRIASGGNRAGFVHHSGHGPSLLRRRPSWPRGLRAGA